MNAPRLLETERLVLSAPVPDDAEAIFRRYASDPDVTRYLAWPRHTSVDDTRAFLAFSEQQWAAGVGPYLIRSRAGDQLLGSTGLMLDAAGDVMTGYVLAKDAWGRGFATEALMAMVDVAHDFGAGRIRALCHPDHRASQRVLDKCAFLPDQAWTQQTVFPNLAPAAQDTLCYERILK